MKIKKSFKMLIVICAVVLSMIIVGSGVVNSIAEIDGGVHEYTKAVVHIGHFIW